MLTRSIIIPARTGPAILTVFQTRESIATALTMCSGRTSLGDTLARLGWSTACPAPMMTAAKSRCQLWTMPVNTDMARRTTTVAVDAWAAATRNLGSHRSASTPPSRFSASAGTAIAIPSRARSIGSPVSLNICQCMVNWSSI